MVERIFTNSLVPAGEAFGVLGEVQDFAGDDDTYQAMVAALITDTVDYEESMLSPEREENMRYYYGLEPSLSGLDETVYNSADTSSEEDEPVRSSIVSTDVRDVIMAIMPSLMRIFAASEHSVDFQSRTEQGDDYAKQATDYIRYKFWEENEGFLILYSAIKDCLQNRIGVITWWTENKTDIRVETYQNITLEQAGLLVSEGAEIIEQSPIGPNGTISNLAVRFQKEQPALKVEAVPLDEFRVSRRARRVSNANIIGREQYLRASDLIALGYDPEDVLSHVGASMPYVADRWLHNPFDQMDNDPFNDLVRYGDYYVRIDRDGDGVAEVRRICTMGDNFTIVDDNPVNNVPYSVFSPDPKQHALIGDAITELAKDIQRINTNLIRGSLDSLAQSINPRTAINETLTNVEDALNDDLGAVIRTRGNPRDAVFPIVIPFVGADAFSMKQQMDAMRQSRTGISEASKGVDPKALQSTAVVGIDLIANGAQERIELIARIIAETGLAPMYRGLLQEVTNNQNQKETVKLRGKWTEVNPSIFDPGMRCTVNPALGKGSDMTRLTALADVKNTQLMVIEKFGLNNGIVGVDEVRNTIVDMLAIANIRNVSRYFKEVTPEVKAAIEQAPKEPDPATLLAHAEMEKVKKDVVVAQANLDQQSTKNQMDDDFRRDKMEVDMFTDLVGIMAQFASAEVPEDTVQEGRALNTPVR